MFLIAMLLGCTPVSNVLDFGAEAGRDPSAPAVVAERRQILDESAVCFVLVGAHNTKRDIVAIGMDTRRVAPVQLNAVPQTTHLHSIARVDHNVYTCSAGEGLTRINMLTGKHVQIDRRCTGATDVGGELVITERGHAADGLHWIGRWADAKAGEDILVGEPRYDSRIGRIDGTLISTHHSGREVLRQTPSGEFEQVRLAGWDGWFEGISGAGGRLFALGDRDQEGSTEFDEAGEEVDSWPVAGDVPGIGLTCSGPLDPETYEDLDPLLGSGPPLDL